MKRMKQGYDARLDESLGMRHRGPHKQSLSDRRHESEAMEKHYGKGAYAGDAEMDESEKKRHLHHMKAAHHRYMAKMHRRKMHKR